MKLSLFTLTILLFSLAQAHLHSLDLILVPSSSSPSHLAWTDTVKQMQSRDHARTQFLSSLASARKPLPLPVVSGRQILQSSGYVVKINFGSPGQPLLLALDNGYDSTWVPCAGCIGCSSAIFDPAKSTSFSGLACGAAECTQVINPSCFADTCGFNYTYGSSTIQAKVVQDTLMLGQDLVRYTFGCIQSSSGTSFPPQGLLGLGRGPMSLMSQTNSLYNSTFSYCLPSYKSTNFTGLLRLGPAGQPVKIKTTPLLRSPRRSSLYYVNMIGIKVGSKTLDIPPTDLAFDSATGAGTVFDSAITFTSLVKPAYTALRDEIRRRMGNATVSSLGGFDTCYDVPIKIPTITFVFDGMQVTLPPDNFLIRSSAGPTSCLAMAAAPDNFDSVLNIIGSYQQQNHRVFFDVPNSRVGVARQNCS